MKTTQTHIPVFDILICAIVLAIIAWSLWCLMRALAEEEAIRRANREARRREIIESHKARIKRGIGKYEHRHNQPRHQKEDGI